MPLLGFQLLNSMRTTCKKKKRKSTLSLLKSYAVDMEPAENVHRCRLQHVYLEAKNYLTQTRNIKKISLPIFNTSLKTNWKYSIKYFAFMFIIPYIIFFTVNLLLLKRYNFFILLFIDWRSLAYYNHGMIDCVRESNLQSLHQLDGGQLL